MDEWAVMGGSRQGGTDSVPKTVMGEVVKGADDRCVHM